MNFYSLVLKSKMEFKVHTKLYNFQKETVTFLQTRETQNKNSLILNEAGLGKSITMLKFIETSPLPTLIICPSNLIYNWLNEVLTHTNYTQSQVNIFHGSNRKINDALITISSYSIITNSIKNKELFEKINSTFSRVILDEGQFIRNKKTLTSIAMLELTIPKRILMTATPIFNRIDDLYPIFKFLEFIGDRVIRFLENKKNDYFIQFFNKITTPVPTAFRFYLYFIQFN
jgi:SNF2 family DNA or RNA helicase